MEEKNTLFPVLFASHRIEDEIRAARRNGLQFMVIGIPWGLLKPHEEQARRNHSQTLKQLAGRGGLGADEAVAIIENRRHRRMSVEDAHTALRRHIEAFAASEIGEDR